MSIASPRPSITLSSRRTSVDTVASTHSKTNSQAVERGSLRRNRTALRDYYNLKAAQSAENDPSTPITPTLDPDQESELDKPGFQPEQYVQNLLSSEDLYGVLRIEAGLVSDIRNLDGEKKALVYDNYSKLITATDTIRIMREKMDPMMPGTSTLGPAIGHIAETAAALKKEMRAADVGAEQTKLHEKRKQQELVRWVLGSAGRIEGLKRDHKDDEAEQEWQKVSSMLDKWTNVKGVQEVRKACLEALNADDDG
ncbi:putative vacuolar protein sorting-associated protein [Septoria linicola]|nr:putative vacuolar protein sorting-associated protein [Septoria linicola]